MAERKSIIPEGYEEREFSLDDYIAAKVAEAVKNESERKYGVGRPASNRNGEFEMDIATATGDYGDGYTAYTRDDLEKLGFRQLRRGEKPAAGDLARVPTIYNDHVVTTPHKTEGRYYFVRKPLEGGGFEGSGFEDGDDYRHDIIMKPNYKERSYGLRYYDPIYYRFFGTDEDRSEIEQHNERVRQLKKDAQPIKAEMPTPERITTAEWLGKILRK
jgi:hypothetical protein